MPGFDPRQRRLEAERKQRAILYSPAPLDPEYPFPPIAFDPFFFGLQVDPPKPQEPGE